MPSNFLIYTEKPTQYVWALFNLTQPKQVATNDANNSLHGRFQSNATRVGCNRVLIGKQYGPFQSNATRVGCNVPQVLPVLSAIYFNLTQPVWVATRCTGIICKIILHFNLTQPVWVATANLHKRSNKLSCILYNVCLFFDQTIWSDTTYCNGTISFLYNIWCEATSKTMFTYHSHLLQTKIPSPHNEMAVC